MNQSICGMHDVATAIANEHTSVTYNKSWKQFGNVWMNGWLGFMAF